MKTIQVKRYHVFKNSAEIIDHTCNENGINLLNIEEE